MALLKLLTALTLSWVVIETKEGLSLDDVTAVVGEKFVYQIGNDDFLSTYKIHRIVQKGKKKLPEWLTFDANSSLLIGYPKTDNVGMYTLRLRALCINPAEMSCQDRISLTFHVHVNEPLKSAESRGRHTFSKHDNNGEWIYTNTINGNKRLYVEYDITRHGTVLEKTSGMLVSSSMHVPSISLSYSAMQYGDIANYLHNKKMHDKLSINNVLTMKYNTHINYLYLPEEDIQDKNLDLPPQVQFVTKTFIGSIHNSDTHVASQFSSMLYSSDIDSVHYSDFFGKFSANALTTFAFSRDKNTAGTHVYGYSDKYSSIISKTGTFGNLEKYQPEESMDDSQVLRHKSLDRHLSESIRHENLKQKFCHSDDETMFYASLIIYVAYNLTNAQESLLIKKWSDFISKEQNVIFISRTEADGTGLQNDGKYILTAGPGNVIESLKGSVEVSWHLACGFFEQVQDFTRVLQHNIDAGRVSEELGFDVIAWYVYTDRPLPKRVKRQANMGKRQTGTPTFSPPVPSTLSDEFISATTISLLSVSVTSPFAVTTYFSTVTFPSFNSVSELSALVSLATVMSFSSLDDSALITGTTGSITFSTSDIAFKSTIHSLVMSSSDLTTKSALKSTARTTMFETFSYSMNFSGSVITSIDYSIPSLSSSLPSFSESEFMSLPISSEIPSISSFSSSLEHSDVISKMMSISVLSYTTFSDSVFSTVPSSVLISPDTSTKSALFSNISTLPTSVVSLVAVSKSSVRTDNQPFSYSLSTPLLETSLAQSLSFMSVTSFSSGEILSVSTTLTPSSFSISLLSSTLQTFVLRPSLQISSHLISTLFSVPKSVDPVSISVSSLESFITPSSSLPSNYGTFSSEVDSEITSTSFKFSELTSFQNIGSTILSSSSSVLSFFTSDSIPVVSFDSTESFTNAFTFSVSEVTASSEFQSIPHMSVSSSHGSVFTQISLSTSTLLVPVITTYSALAVTLIAMTSLQSKTSLFSITATSSDSVEAFSPTIVSSILSSEGSVKFNMSDLLSSSRSESSHQNFSSYKLTTTTTAAISYSSSGDIVPSFYSTSSATRETVRASVSSYSTVVYTTVSSAQLHSQITLTTVPAVEESSVNYSSLISVSPTRVLTISSLTVEFPVDSTVVVTTAAPDESPSLKKSIDHLEVIIGRYYMFQIPEDTFSDSEDGNTRNLSLRISLTYSKQFPKDAWLMFNETSQSLFGIPLKSDLKGDKLISEFTLIAKDSEGQVAKDAITITYKYETNVNHKISMKLNGTYEKFVADRRNLIQFASMLTDFYGDKTLKFLSFSEIEEGSVVVVWSNNSLFGENCMKNKIEDLYNRVNDENGTVTNNFQALFLDFPPISSKLEYFGACLLPLTSVAPPTKAPVSKTDNKMWIEIVLPALIAILVIVIIALLLLICCRHRRPRKDVKDSDKPAFLEDRRPIIFPEELEMVDPSLKSKTPLVLPSDYLTETPPAVPSHGRAAPPYRTPMLDDGTFPGEDEDAPPPPPHRGQSQQSEPPPYRLPPPYYNPHRMT